MKIKIVQHVPTKPSPEIGKVYEVTKTNEPNERNGGAVYFVMCEGVEVGVLAEEMEIVEDGAVEE